MAQNTDTQDGRLPAFHVDAASVPQAYYRALKAVHFGAPPRRTQYDRKDRDGNWIDPPGRDARVSIRIEDPFAQPRFPALSYCERGKYIAEILGSKDHLVVPYPELIRMIGEGKEFAATQWPYCYHQRLAAYPKADGTTLDQLEMILDRLARDPISRCGVATTRVPEIALFMSADLPCLGEVQLRAIEDGDGVLHLNMHTVWRSRDLYKAWGDNVIGVTSLQARLAARLSGKMNRPVRVGAYSENNGSLHIYGQDYKEEGMDRFFDRFHDEASFLKRARPSDQMAELEIIPQLQDHLKEETWNFPPSATALIEGLIRDYTDGTFTA
jgi:hypothetical protein